MPNLFIRDCYYDQFAHFPVFFSLFLWFDVQITGRNAITHQYMIFTSSNILNMMTSVHCTVEDEK